MLYIALMIIASQSYFDAHTFMCGSSLSTAVPEANSGSRGRQKVRVHYQEEVISDDDEYLCKYNNSTCIPMISRHAEQTCMNANNFTNRVRVIYSLLFMYIHAVCDDCNELHHGECPVHGALRALPHIGHDQSSLQYTKVYGHLHTRAHACTCTCIYIT